MNKEWLLQLADFIEGLPDYHREAQTSHLDKAFDMETTGVPIDGSGGCGTAACIAGWTVHLFAGVDPARVARGMPDGKSVRDTLENIAAGVNAFLPSNLRGTTDLVMRAAQALLRLDDVRAKELFMPGGELADVTPGMAAEALRRLVRTGEVSYPELEEKEEEWG
jgi:hypothetical protein